MHTLEVNKGYCAVRFLPLSFDMRVNKGYGRDFMYSCKVVVLVSITLDEKSIYSTL